ncbi:LPS export ABC transporter permease LptG [Wenxinia marina]|uniref:Putative permease n=1 Tax=Wenxinia marina DSM 24838 TaxID=1123501 RepID=A0A0D0QA56_9RHOB|nr:LPS export ABC transporter permease LptG [Wenxinia marina]KIQ67888.1 putative permease [Wenxinia marina DSM 24838]GGL74320.1 LPS export ABC transporter permease LptG [Wenxinia marina]
MILFRYLARRYLMTFLGTLGVFVTILLFVNLIEQARRFGGEETGLGALLGLSALDIPGALYRILPLVVVIATLFLFFSLSRSSELVVTRAAGRSALRALTGPLLVTVLIGAVAVAALNPIVAVTAREYDARVATIRGEDSALGLDAGGLWLRQGGAGGQTVINAARTNQDGTVLWDATFLTFAEESGDRGGPVQRIAAARAILGEGGWTLYDAKVWPLGGGAVPEALAEEHPRLTLPSTLTSDQIRDSFGDPATIPVWELPAFIERLRAAGFAARRHEVALQTELASPAFLVAMMLIGAAFTMRHHRAGRTGVMVLSAMLVCFGVYFLRNFATVLGENGEIPAALAAWAPPAAAIALTLGVILHLEDG